MAVPVLRVARPTDRLEEVVKMYTEGLGLEVLGSFDDHDGFDGVMVGRKGCSYHLEFTRERGKTAGGSPSPEHLLVFYEEDGDAWEARCDAMEAAGFERVVAHNPYWEGCGRTFRDVDQYCVVVVNGPSPV